MNVVITGGNKGIGKEILDTIISNEYNVNFIITFCSDVQSTHIIKEMYSYRKDINIDFFQCDFRKKESIIQFSEYVLKRFQKIDWIVLNAAIPYYKRFDDYVIEEWEEIIRCNLTSPVFLIKNLKNNIKSHGKIILMGSHAGNIPFSRSLAYNVSKGGINYLSKCLVKELYENKICINTIAPGFIETNWHDGRSKESYEIINKKIAAGRFGSVKEVADMTYSVLKNNYVNGSILEIHGGYNFNY